MKNPVFNEMLKQRDLNVVKLADLIVAGRAHLVQVLCGARTGRQTWRRLERVLTYQEYACAKNFADAARVAPESNFLDTRERE